MWHDGEVVFLSDQGGTANLWRMAPDGTGRTPLTDFTTWDVRWPAMGPDGTVVFTVGADLHRYDPATDEVVRIAVDLPSDRVLTRTRYRAGGKDLQGLDLAPDGERLLVEVRGELFSVPVKEGVTLPVTRGTGARERGASYGAEGKRVYFWSDAGREDALHRKDAWGRGEAEVIREGEAGPWPYALHPSPDGDWLAWVDSDDDLRVMPAGGGQARVADHGEHRRPRHLAWSPDGRWLAYVKALANKQFSIFVYDTEAGEAHAVTDRWTEDHSPAWDPDGRYLYFVSGRAHNPVLGNLDFQNVEVRHEKLYALLLTADAPHPLRRDAGLPPAAEAEEEGEDAAEDPGEDPEGGDDPAPVTIDLEGIASRVVELPVDFGDHAALQATASHLFFVSNPLQGMAEGPEIFAEPEPRAVLMSYSLEDREATPFVAGISAYDLEPGAGKLAVMKRRGQVFVVDAAAPPGEALAEGKVDLGDAVVELDPRAEWAQVYWEAWRQMRAFYWDPGLGGLDWPAIGERYATLLPRLTSRADLGDLVGQLYGEASTSHSYVFGGDPGKQVPRVPVGLLGAELEREDDAYRIARILRGDPADRVRSPLDEPGADADAGDYILAVAGRPVADAPNLHALLAGLAGKQVLLTVADDPGGEKRREVLVTPLRSDRDLRYVDWVRRNREYVAAQTDGKIGYVHVPDMSKDGLIAFNKWFYPQLDREGMIVDVRFNGGGFVSQMLLERLRRPLLAYDRTRSGAIDTYPARTLNGPFVVLTNQNAGSDGDIFPQAVQLEGLAPVIGTRSWGGVVGITGLRPLQDGGLVTQPMVAWWDPREGWGVENHGVEPDIEVQNLPQDEARGVDAQLDRGIAEVLRLHAAEPPQEPDFGPVPPRTREAYRDELR
jgi:tricorn protease